MGNALRMAAIAVVAVLASGTAVSAGAEHIQVIGEQCGVQLGLSPAACTCIADSAASQLTNEQQAFMAAQVLKDQGEIARLQASMTVGDMTTVGTFMTSIVGQCRG